MKGNLRNIAPKLIIVLVVFAGFLFYMNWSQGKEPTFQISDDFSTVDSEKELMEKITRQLTRSELASNYKLFSEVDYETVLLEEQRSLKIEKVWYHNNTLHMIYSVDVKEKDEVDSDVPTLTFDEISVSAEGDNFTFNLGTSNGPPTNWLNKGFIHNYRLYRGVLIHLADSEEDYKALEKIHSAGSIDYIRIELPRMIYGSYEKGKVIEPMAFNVQLETSSEDVLETIELNKTTTLNNDLKIDWDEMLLYINSTRLTFEMESPNRLLQSMNLRVSKTNGEIYKDKVMVEKLGNNRYEAYIRTFREFPNEFSLEVTGLEFMEEGAPLDYTIDETTIDEGVTLTQGEQQTLNEKIGSKHDMDIFFRGLTHEGTSDYGNEQQSDLIGIAIGLENIPKRQFETWFNYVREGMQNLKYNNLGDSEAFRYVRGPLIEITNQDGQLVEPFGSRSAPSIDQEVQVILVNKGFIEKATEINLKLSHFPVYEQVEENKTTFSLTSKGVK